MPKVARRGTERGWDQIAEVFYTKTMGGMFTQRGAQGRRSKDWKLVHAPYSGPPIGGPSQGFLIAPNKLTSRQESTDVKQSGRC
jgi:hypothetical protein